MADTVIYGSNPEREQVAKASNVAVTGGSVANLFTISGGPVLLLALVGEITATVSNNSCTAKLVCDPTTGADTDLCGTLDIKQDVIGGFWFITGLDSDALINAVPGTTLPRGMAVADGTALHPVVLPVGTIDLTLQNSNPTTGSADWYLRYKPLTPNARVSGSG
jgi:hypothetical protein